MDEILSEQTSDRRFNVVLLSVFAALGVGLAVVGVYGIVAYSVSQRRREVAIRVAIGASGATVLWTIVRDGVALGVCGCLLGVAAAAGGANLVAGFLYGVSPRDPVVFGGAAVLLLVVVVTATIVPARRALSIDPLVLLKE